MGRIILLISFIMFCLAQQSLLSQNLYEVRKDSVKVPRQPYLRYFTKDKFDRLITFYLSENTSSEKLPLVVYVHGSGGTSHFAKNNDQIIPKNGHISVYESLQGKARLLIVEKPGVKYLDAPSHDELMKNTIFQQQHSLDKWTEAINAAIIASIQAGLADSNRILVMGHSEGGLVASKVTNNLSSLVSHTAILAGGGNSQLYDIISLARKGLFFRHISEDPEKRVQYVLEEWEKIQQDSLSSSKFFFGHSYKRWFSFLKSSPIEELQNVSAEIFIAQGVLDDALDHTSADHLYTYLLSKGKNVFYDRLENADHSFNNKLSPDINGWKNEMEKIVKWFLK